MYPGHPGHVSRHHQSSHQYDQAKLAHLQFQAQQQAEMNLLTQIGAITPPGALMPGAYGMTQLELLQSYQQQQLMNHLIEQELRESRNKQKGSQKSRSRHLPRASNPTAIQQQQLQQYQHQQQQLQNQLNHHRGAPAYFERPSTLRVANSQQKHLVDPLAQMRIAEQQRNSDLAQLHMFQNQPHMSQSHMMNPQQRRCLPQNRGQSPLGQMGNYAMSSINHMSPSTISNSASVPTSMASNSHYGHTDPLLNNPFMTWNQSTPSTPSSTANKSSRPSAIASTASLNSARVTDFIPNMAPSRSKRVEETQLSEPVRVIAPSLLREREKQRKRDEQKKKRLSEGSQSQQLDSRRLSGHIVGNRYGTIGQQRHQIIRPPVIQPPLNLRQPYTTNACPNVSTSTNIPSSIPPFELPVSKPNPAPVLENYPSRVHTSGLNGPIYKTEELLKPSTTNILRDKANSKPTSVPTNQPPLTDNEVYSSVLKRRDGESVNDWFISLLKSDSSRSNNQFEALQKVQTRKIWDPPDPTATESAVNPNCVRPEIIIQNKSRSVAEAYPLLAQAISKCQSGIWASGHSKDEPRTSLLPFKAEPQEPPKSSTDPTTSPSKLLYKKHCILTPAKLKFENNKRAASPSEEQTEIERKRSKSSSEERRRVESHDSEYSNVPLPSAGELLGGSKINPKIEPPEIELYETKHTSNICVKEEPDELPSTTTPDISLTATTSAADDDSDTSIHETKHPKRPRKQIKRKERIKEELPDHKIMKTINRTLLPSNVKKLSCKASAGETLLHAAARRGYLENIAYYLELGMGIDSRDNAGFTALHEAVTKGHYRCVKLLLEQGSNPNAQSSDGTRPIHDVAENGDFQILRLLLSFGADPTLTLYSGETPLELAEDSEKTKLLLQEYLNYITEANCDDAITYPGDHRDIDLYEEDSLGSIPSCSEQTFEIEISDDPLPISYWLTIGDRTDNYLRLKDVESKISNHNLEITTIHYTEFKKQIERTSFVSFPDDIVQEQDVKLVRLNLELRNLIGSKTWSTGTKQGSTIAQR